MDGGVSLFMDVAGICLSALRLACLCLDAKEETLHRTERATLGRSLARLQFQTLSF